MRGEVGGPDVVRTSAQRATLELIFFAPLCSGTLMTSSLLFIARVRKVNTVFWQGVLSSE